MSFVTSKDRINQIKSMEFKNFDSEMLSVVYLTKKEIMKKLLPPPLVPWDTPLAWVLSANYTRTNFGNPYYEAALLLAAEYNGVPGLYCPAISVTDDMAMVAGREMYGYPKKMVNIHLSKEDQIVLGWIEHQDIRFFETRVDLTGSYDDPQTQDILNKLIEHYIPFYTFIRHPAPVRL